MTWLAGPAWLAGIVAIERLARHRTSSRARGWIAGYTTLGILGLLIGPAAPSAHSAGWGMAPGLVLATAGYPLGRAIMCDRPNRPPPDGTRLELVALAGLVAPVEELIWGAIVEPAAGVGVTAVLFAAKHPLVDGRWRRMPGLFLFWVGLGLVRSVSWPAALVLHVVLNAGGVLIGHARGADQF